MSGTTEMPDVMSGDWTYGTARDQFRQAYWERGNDAVTFGSPQETHGIYYLDRWCVRYAKWSFRVFDPGSRYHPMPGVIDLRNVDGIDGYVLSGCYVERFGFDYRVAIDLRPGSLVVYDFDHGRVSLVVGSGGQLEWIDGWQGSIYLLPWWGAMVQMDDRERYDQIRLYNLQLLNYGDMHDAAGA